MPYKDFTQISAEKNNAWHTRGAEITKTNIAAMRHAARARELEAQIRAKELADQNKPTGQPRAKA